MEYKELKSLFDEGVSSQFNFDPFWKYLNLLLKWNEKINLTSLECPKRIIEEHFIDSLQLAPYVDGSPTLLDIGSGGGFPGIPLKIVFPKMKVTLVDSIKKKCDFMKAACRELKLVDVDVHKIRLTENDNIGKFNAIVSRGTMPLKDLVKISAVCRDSSAKMIFLKGDSIDDEISKSMSILDQYGLSISTKKYVLPYSKRVRIIVSIVGSSKD